MTRKSSLFVLSFLFCVLAAYIVLSIGIIDRLYILPNRASALQQLELAVQSSPADVDSVLKYTASSDWFVASVALRHLENLKKSNELSAKESHQALTITFDNLGEGGHWWRFGWDREEVEFNQFYSQVIRTASVFGDDLLPWLQITSQDNNPKRREAVCRIIGQVPRGTMSDENYIFLDSTRNIVQGLVELDSNSLVVSTCNRVLQKFSVSSQ